MYILDICLLCEIKGDIFDFNEKSACTVAEPYPERSRRELKLRNKFAHFDYAQ